MQIDNLEIRIKAEADSAISSLAKLEQRLDVLSGSLSRLNGKGLTQLSIGVKSLSTAMTAMQSVKKVDFNRVASGLSRLTTMDFLALNRSASSIGRMGDALRKIATVSKSSADLGTFANHLSKLGSVKIERALVNIPRLANAIKSMMTTLSSAPQVSQNILAMVNSLSQLASPASRIGSATKRINSGLNKTNSVMAKTRNSAFSLASAFGRFYATYFLVIRGLKSLWNSIENSMDYIETFNYFNEALKKVEREFKTDFERFGYESAEAYAESFSERFNQLTNKMTGYQIGDNGELLMTDYIGLGLDPEAIMSYQAKIVAVTNSVGILGETSINTALAFTRLASDMSSLTNVDLETVMQNLQSGLAGQSRVMYKYGVDITNATLQTYALQYGIDEAVSSMTQSEKMQLRILAILDQMRIAWGDQADTINTVANQYRIFKQQVSNLGRTIGDFFMPIIKNVLPVINGLIIALRQLFYTMGFTLWGENWLKDAMDSISGSATTEIEDLETSLEDATDAAKKLKTNLLGIDELNVVSNTEDIDKLESATANLDLSKEIADALEEYEKVWEQAYQNMENDSEKFANKIIGFFKPIGVVVSNIANNFKDGFDDVFNLGQVENYQKSIERLSRSFISLFSEKEVRHSLDEVMSTASKALGSITASAISVGLSISTGVANGVADANEEMQQFNTDKITSVAESASKISKNYENLSNTVAKIAETFEGEEFSNIVSIFTQLGDAVLLSKIEEMVGKLADIETFFIQPITDNGDLIADIFHEITSVIEDILAPLGNLIEIITGHSMEYEEGWFHKFMQMMTVIASADVKAHLEVVLDVLQRFGDTVEWARENWETFLSLFDKETMEKYLADLAEPFKEAFGKVVKVVVDAMNNVITAINNALSFEWEIKNPFSGKTEEISFGVNIPLIPVPQYKNGGFVEDGLFMANHNELVGQFTNGKTAVANNEQIVLGIENGVERAVSRVLAPYLADIAQNTRETADKDMSVNIGDRDIARASNRGQRLLGHRLITEG